MTSQCYLSVIDSELVKCYNINMEIETNKVYTTKEVCQILKISEVTARLYCRTNRIKATKAGKGWKILGQSIVNYLQGQPQSF